MPEVESGAERRGDERRGAERRGNERRDAEGDVGRSLRVRWGKVVREDQDAESRPPPEKQGESPGQRVARDRRRGVLRRQTELRMALAVSLVLIAILLLRAIVNT